MKFARFTVSLSKIVQVVTIALERRFSGQQN